MTSAEALHLLDTMRLSYPFEVQTRVGPCLLAKGTITPELAASLLPHEAEYRRKGYTVRMDEKTGKWTVCQWVRLVWTTPEPLETPAPEPAR
jgi:hypothetical protein